MVYLITERQFLMLSSNIIVEEVLKDKFINESLTASDKSEIKTIIKRELKDFLNINKISDLDKKISDLAIKAYKKDKDIENQTVEIVKNVLVQLYKNLWVKRNFWANDLKNLAS